MVIFLVLDIDMKYELITRNLQEVTGSEQIKSILAKRDLKIYWGTATTGKPHVGYLIPFSKMADFLEAGSEVTILLADIHAFLDSQKTPWELLDLRVKYYSEVIRATLNSMGVDTKKLKFVKGSDFQLDKKYSIDVYRLCAISTVNEGKHAGAEVVKQAENPKIAPLIYPLLQALDEEYLGVDCEFGGADQRKIFMYAEEYLPKIGYAKRSHLMNPMVPGLQGSKMSSSDASSKIDLTDSEADIKKKLNGAFCPEGTTENNGVMMIVKYVIFPYLNRTNSVFLVERPEKFGGNLEFKSYNDLENIYIEKKLHPLDLKQTTAKYLSLILKGTREHFEKKEMAELSQKAYLQS